MVLTTILMDSPYNKRIKVSEIHNLGSSELMYYDEILNKTSEK